jgi:aminomethyltransferase
VTADQPLLKTPLHAMHIEAGAKMVPFAGYDMPVQYAGGIIREHTHTRSQAGLFDVSHMGQARLIGRNIAAALEALVPSDMQALPSAQQRYTVLVNEKGGVIDDLMVARQGDDFYLVVNAACKRKDFDHLRALLPSSIRLEELPERALLALQGPQAVEVLANLAPAVRQMRFMDFAEMKIAGVSVRLTRSGYTGEDGFEISLHESDAEAFARRLLADERTQWTGLGARDSLRMEAGLCLYGHELTESITPIEAGIAWVVTKVRRVGGERAGGYPGAAVIDGQLASGPARRKVALLVDGKAPVREGADIVNVDGKPVGLVCSGGYSPTLARPIAIAFVDSAHAGEKLAAVVRGKPLAVTQTTLPFVPHRYYRG